MSEKIRYTGRIYKCPKCGKTIEGYWESFWKMQDGQVYKDDRPEAICPEKDDEDEDEFFWKEEAGCVNCLDCWDAKDLKDITPVRVQFD